MPTGLNQTNPLLSQYNASQIPMNTGMFPDFAQFQLQQAQYFNAMMQNQNLAAYGANSSQSIMPIQPTQILSHHSTMIGDQMGNNPISSQNQVGNQSSSRFVLGNIVDLSMCLNSPLPLTTGKAVTTSQSQVQSTTGPTLVDPVQNLIAMQEQR